MNGLIRGLTQNRAETSPTAEDRRLRGRTYAIPFETVWSAALALAGPGPRATGALPRSRRSASRTARTASTDPTASGTSSTHQRWSPNGAHLLLQVRAELVDGRLGDTFGRWYPDFTGGENQLYQVAA